MDGTRGGSKGPSASRCDFRRVFSVVYEYLTFGYITPLLDKGDAGTLDVDSARAHHPADLDPQRLLQRFDNARTVRKPAAPSPKEIDAKVPTSRKGVLWTCISLEKWSMIGNVSLLMLSSAIRLGTPVALREFLKWLVEYQDDDASLWRGVFWAIVMTASAVLLMFVYHRQIWTGLMSGFRIRTMLTAVIHAKLLRLNSSSIAKLTTGRVVNMVSGDLRRCDFVMTVWPFLLIGPIEAILVLVAVALVLGLLPAFAGMSCLLLTIPIQAFLSKYIRKWRQKTAVAADKRIGLTGEMITGNLAVKMLGWETPLVEDISAIRRREHKLQVSRSMIKGLNAALPSAVRALVVCVMFITYRYTEGDFNVPDVFFALSLIMLPRTSLTMLFVGAVELVTETLVTSKRLDEFLAIPEPHSAHEVAEAGAKGEIEMADGNYGWYEDKAAAKPPSRTKSMTQLLQKALSRRVKSQPPLKPRQVLTDVTFSVRPGELVGVAGIVGSGKSSLLAALLNDMEDLTDTRSVWLTGRVAYCAQTPWIVAGSVKENITFGKDFDEAYYQEVACSCALETDFDQLPEGDATMLGERGINISGGQKARVALARAAYSRAEIQLLDDPLSAVDPRVGRILFDRCIGPEGVMRGTTRLLVTHQRQFLPLCDRIIVVHEGRIETVGRWEDVQEHPLLRVLQADDKAETILDVEQKAAFGPAAGKAAKSTGDLQQLGKNEQTNGGVGEKTPKAGQLVVAESKQVGRVGFSVYWDYICHIGCVGMLFAFVALGLGQGLYFFAEAWIGIWATASKADQKDSKWVYGLISSSAAASLFSIASILALYALTLSGSTRLHQKMLNRVVHAPLKFFHVNPTGRILNRFSKDQGLQDEELPMLGIQLLVALFTVLGTVGLVCTALPYMTIFFVFVTWIFARIRRRYVVTSREVKRFDGISRSPVYAMLSDNMKGLATIRAFGSEQAFQKRFSEALDLNASWWSAFMLTSRWVGFRMDVVSCGIMFFSVAFAVLLADSVPPEVMGLALTYVIGLTGMLQMALRQTAELENAMTAVERNLEYTRLEQEPPKASEGGGEAPEGWPETGSIEYSALTATYRPGLEPVLRNLSFAIPGGSAVGIVGRTGSGKSSLLLTLFRLIDVEEGHIRIDGVDTSSIGIDVLRQQLAVIPQDPVLFGGTLRSNVDPWKQHSDARVWQMLQQVCLDNAAREAGGLDASISECGGNLSVGQRQLLCLARALLADAKILALDEATANVDRGTDALIQASLRSLITQNDKTLLIIAHRIDTVMDCDLLLVLDDGEVAEFGSPQELVSRKDGMFAGMVAAATNAVAET